MMNLLTRIRRQYSDCTTPSVFILGNQKSGTTVIAAVLAECAGVSVTLDLHAIHTTQVTAEYVNRSLTVTKIKRLCGRHFRATVVKEPILTFYAEELLASYANSRFVFIVRDPRDNIRSILNRLKLPGDQDRLAAKQWANVPAVWREVVENRRLGFSTDNYIESLALRWLYAWQQSSIASERMVTIRYEDFVADKVSYTHRLARLVGLQPRVDPLKSVDKQFQGRGDREASWSTFFGKNIAVINDVCRSAMLELGYELGRDRAELPDLRSAATTRC